jgi:hypothetical protein
VKVATPARRERRSAVGRQGKVGEVVLDPEFQNLLPPPEPDERRQIEASLLAEGCREPLVVWPCQGRLLLLVGYEVFPVLRLYRLPFRVIEKQFGSRDEARLFIVKDLLKRRYLSPLAMSYLRGLRYREERQEHGGDRKSASARAEGFGGKTAEALAEIFGVSPATIRRDGAVTRAVHAVAEHCGPDAKALLLSRRSKVSRGRLLALAALEPARQKAVVGRLGLTGKMPRSLRDGAPASTTLPSEARAMAEALLKRRGRAWFSAFCEVAIDLLTAPDAKANGEGKESAELPPNRSDDAPATNRAADGNAA